MRVLVTGGAGFIGSHVVDRLLAAGVQPRTFDLRRSEHHAPGRVETFVGDLLDPAALQRAMQGCDAVAHLAAMADADVVARRPDDAERVNSRGTLNVLQAAREAGVRRVIYASTIWVYSNATDDPVDEDSATGLPGHLYTATKLAGEMYCRSYAELYGLEYTILRFGIPYGPRARPEAVIPTFVGKALAGEPLTIAGGGKQSRRFVYVEDLADGVVRALDEGAANRVYNLVGDEDITIATLAEEVQRTVAPVPVVDTPGRGADFAGARVSGERAERELGWRASTPFAVGMERYVAWHRAQPAAVSQRRRLTSALAPLRARAMTAALLCGLAGILAVFVEVLHDTTWGSDELETMTVTFLLALTAYLALHRRGRQTGLVWLSAGVLALVVLRSPYDVLRLADSDLDLIVQSTIGSALGVATGVTSLRMLSGPWSRRAEDTSG